MVDFDSALGVILDLTDTTLEREYSSRLLQKQAEYDAMRSQINPHFLYNTLDTIRGYAVIEDAPITGDMIELLSRLFRYTVSQKNVLVPLHREISILNDYIKIQEYRINQHIIYVQKIDPDLDIMDYRIPRLIVQPFIENAVKHGMRGIRRDFIITLSIYRTQSRLVISVADNGCGMTAKQLQQLNERLAGGESEASQSDSDTMKKAGSGIALTNVNARIRLIYGSDYGVTAFSSPGDGAEFQIALPYLAAERSS